MTEKNQDAKTHHDERLDPKHVKMGVRDPQDLKKGAHNPKKPMTKKAVSPHNWTSREDERDKQQFSQKLDTNDTNENSETKH